MASRRQLTMKTAETLVAVSIAILAGVVGVAFVAIAGASPTSAASAIWNGSFNGSQQLSGTLAKTVPLVFVAMGWILVFRAGRFHVGFPGQITVGGIFATLIGLHLSGAPMIVHLPLAIIVAILGGLLYAGVAAWLWARHDVNEILSTLLLNLIAAPVLDWLVSGPLMEKGAGVPATPPLSSSSLWPLLSGGELHWDIALVPICIVAGWFFLTQTRFGARLKLVGANPRAALTCGLAVRRIGVNSILLSGALAGLAGASLVLAGDYPGVSNNFEGGYGFYGIAVALLARNSPWGVFPAALLFAALLQSTDVLQAQLNVSTSVVGVMQGATMLLALAASTLFYAIRRRYRMPARRLAAVTAEPPALAAKETVEL